MLHWCSRPAHRTRICMAGGRKSPPPLCRQGQACILLGRVCIWMGRVYIGQVHMVGVLGGKVWGLGHMVLVVDRKGLGLLLGQQKPQQ